MKVYIVPSKTTRRIVTVGQTDDIAQICESAVANPTEVTIVDLGDVPEMVATQWARSAHAYLDKRLREFSILIRDNNDEWKTQIGRFGYQVSGGQIRRPYTWNSDRFYRTLYGARAAAGV